MDYEYIKQNATASGRCGLLDMHWYYFEKTLYIEGKGDVYPLEMWEGENYEIGKDVECLVVGEGCDRIESQLLYFCDNLIRVDLPASFEGVCWHHIPYEYYENGAFWLVETMDGDLSDISSSEKLQTINVAEGNPKFASEDGVLFDKEKKTLLCFPCGRTGTYTVPQHIQAIGEDAFGGCDRLEELIIPDSVTEIGHFAFLGVPHITYHGPAQSDNNWGAKSRN